MTYEEKRCKFTCWRDIRICKGEMGQSESYFAEPKFRGAAPSPDREIKYPPTCGWRRRWAHLTTAPCAEKGMGGSASLMAAIGMCYA